MKNKNIKIPMHLGLYLKEIRRENNFTQIELSKESSILQKTISAIEKGNTKCTLETLFKFLRACGYHMELVPNNNINNENDEVEW